MRKIELFTVSGTKVGEFLSLEQMKNILKELDFTEELDLSTIKTEIQKQLLQVEKQRLNKILDSYSYISLADVQFYTSQNDPEAQSILSWYSSYDDLIWQYIDNDLQNITNLDDLLALDIKAVEKQIFDTSIQTAPLP